MKEITREELEEDASLKNVAGIIASIALLIFCVVGLLKEPSDTRAVAVWVVIMVLCVLLTVFLIYRQKKIQSGDYFLSIGTVCGKDYLNTQDGKDYYLTFHFSDNRLRDLNKSTSYCQYEDTPIGAKFYTVVAPGKKKVLKCYAMDKYTLAPELEKKLK